MVISRFKKGMTLLEILIALGLFSIVSLLGITAATEITGLQYYQRINQHMQEEARLTMEFISREALIATSFTYNPATDMLILHQQHFHDFRVLERNFNIIVKECNCGVGIGEHILIGEELKVRDFVITANHQKPNRSFNIRITVEPAERTILRSKKSIYLGPRAFDNLIKPYTLETTITLPDII